MDLAGQVAAALGRSVAPSVIARGGSLRVLAVADGVVTIEAAGSPGATLPLVPRIEALIRSAVPGITSVRVVHPGEEREGASLGDLTEQVRRVLDEEINPTIATHRGHVDLVGVEEGWVRIRLDGGCQGCSLAEVTVRQGIEPLLRSRVPDVVGVIDVTDHESGTDPFFSPAKR